MKMHTTNIFLSDTVKVRQPISIQFNQQMQLRIQNSTIQIEY